MTSGHVTNNLPMSTSTLHDSARFDSQLFDLLPHRPPMLLVNKVVDLSATQSSAIVIVDDDTPFFGKDGVPAWVGIEYMGQTAALIAGYQLQQGLTEPQLGFLLGTRRFQTTVSHFANGTVLLVSCIEKAVVGDSLATFDCEIRDQSSGAELATASLSVFRKALNA